MFCCVSSKPSQNILQRIQPCTLHKNPCSFVCLEQTCEFESLLCTQCIINHRDHKWISLQNFFTQETTNMVLHNTSMLKTAILDARIRLAHTFQNTAATIQLNITELNQQTNQQLADLQQKYTLRANLDVNENNINNILMREIKVLYEKEQKVEWVEQMMLYIHRMIRDAEQSINNIIKDISGAVKISYWQNRSPQQAQTAYQQFKKHLHFHSPVDPNYFKFSPTLKHENIRLNENYLQASYVRVNPSNPAAVANNCLSLNHPAFGIQVIRLNTKAIFFPSTTIFVGVCQPHLVKVTGYRKINEATKGSYMIGSTGWSYHHSDPSFDKVQNVGWGFGEKDKIQVRINYSGSGTLHFRKLGGFFGGNSFQMPLKLKQKQLETLKPCISFDADEDSIVRIYEPQ